MFLKISIKRILRHNILLTLLHSIQLGEFNFIISLFNSNVCSGTTQPNFNLIFRKLASVEFWLTNDLILSKTRHKFRYFYSHHLKLLTKKAWYMWIVNGLFGLLVFTQGSHSKFGNFQHHHFEIIFFAILCLNLFFWKVKKHFYVFLTKLIISHYCSYDK